MAAVDQQLQDCITFLEEIWERLLLAQGVMKEHQNKKRRQVEYLVGGWVWACGSGCTSERRPPSQRPPNSKLGPHYFGPFQIIERIGAVAYRLHLPSKARIQPSTMSFMLPC